MRFPWGVRVLLAAVVVALVVSVGYGIYLVGSPSAIRSIRLDETRVRDLENISWAVNEYWRTRETLPQTLEDVRDVEIHIRSATDPVTEERYEYRPLSGPSYELCAVFDTDSSEHRRESSRSFSDSRWDHGEGRQCFELEAPPATTP